MARVPRYEWYARVNASWPEQVPALTADEAVAAAKKLYRFAHGRSWKGKVVVTSGRNHTRMGYAGRRRHQFDGTARPYAIIVNPRDGWHELVHHLSHWWGPHGHNAKHARYEMRMIKEVVRRGWLEGALKREPEPEPAPIPAEEAKALARAMKVERTDAAIERWERKKRRAENALKKLQRRKAALERAWARRIVDEARAEVRLDAIGPSGLVPA